MPNFDVTVEGQNIDDGELVVTPCDVTSDTLGDNTNCGDDDTNFGDHDTNVGDDDKDVGNDDPVDGDHDTDGGDHATHGDNDAKRDLESIGDLETKRGDVRELSQDNAAELSYSPADNTLEQGRIFFFFFNLHLNIFTFRQGYIFPRKSYSPPPHFFQIIYFLPK